jgi:hypothetical protein
MSRIGFVVLSSLAVLAFACGGSGGSNTSLDAAPLVVAAGSVSVEPADQDRVSETVDLSRISAGGIAAVYELTTPANREFAFDLISRADGNSGPVQISVCHAADAGSAPAGGIESLGEVGIIVNATGATRSGLWIDSSGDGFARCTVRGTIDAEQVLACRVDDGERGGTVLIRIRIGVESEINLAAGTGGDYPGVLVERTLYSSDSWQFGLPTIAVSGDRTSVVVYEGDRADPNLPTRFELRMQYESATHQVTGGGSRETSADWGNWRDHEIAALFNVLARVHSGSEHATLRISFDRGATFAQNEVLGNTVNRGSARLATIAMAADYTLSVFFWQSSAGGGTDLLMVEGRPSSFDTTNSPTQYAFGAPRVLRHVTADVTPTIFGAAYSDGGDLVVGYGYSVMERNDFGGVTTITSFRCAVRLFGEAVFRDVLVDEDEIIGKDPSVALVGNGETMRIYYAYEGRAGALLRVSNDAGRSWSPAITIGEPSSHLPTVIARDKKVDVLYLTYTERGLELGMQHWDDFDTGVSQDYRLTTATRTDDGGAPLPLPNSPLFAPAPGHRVTELSWFGYDAVRDGDDIVIVYDEHTYNGYFWIADIALGAPDIAFPTGGAQGDAFLPVDPPPLAPGMTESLAEPDPEHAHQLKLLRVR